MRKKITLPVLAAIAGLAIAFSVSAFSGKENPAQPDKPLVNHYFQYSVNAADNEAAYENSNNWTYLGTTNPSTDPCSGDNDIVCVLEAPFATTPTPADLASYLVNQTPSATGAETYCRNASNIKHKKPRP